MMILIAKGLSQEPIRVRVILKTNRCPNVDDPRYASFDFNPSRGFQDLRDVT
jgi:hypothetical protein